MRTAVIGAGAVGSQAAKQLAEAGVDTVVFERFDAPNDLGAHSGESRLLRSVPYLETAPGDREILAESIPAWERLQQSSSRRILSQCGGLIIDQSDSDALQLAVEASRRLSRAHSLSHDELVERYPQFSLRLGEAGLLDESGGLADPQEAVAAALAIAEQAGATLRTRTRVTRLHRRPEGIQLELDGGSAETFDRVVLASGAYARELIPALPLRSRRLLLGWFKSKAGREGLLESMPSFVWTPPEGGFLYGGPAEGGTTVKIGIDAPWGEVDDATTGRMVTPDDTAPMRDAAERYLPWLDTSSGRFEMHVDGWSRDGHGLLGPLPMEPRVLIAVGWTGHGFKISPVLGEIVTSLAQGEPTRFDISHLDPGRFPELSGDDVIEP